MEKEDFFGEGGARGVAGETRRQQTTLLEEARGQTISHVQSIEFQRWIEDRHVSVCGEVFSGEASTGV